MSVGLAPCPATAVLIGTPAEESTASLLQSLLVQRSTPDKHPDAEAIDPHSQTPNASILAAAFSGMEAELDVGGVRKGSLVRKASEESVGSADSFSVSRSDCWLGFEPEFGEIPPGRSVSIAVRKSKVNPDSIFLAVGNLMGFQIPRWYFLHAL